MKSFFVALMAVSSVSAFAQPFSINQVVTTSTKAHGKIVAIYSDETVDLDFGSGWKTVNWAMRDIYEVPTQVGEFTVGESVTTTSKAHGKIIAVYNDHSADILFVDK